jgi:hypothetical protein
MSAITIQGPPAPTFAVTAPTSGTITAGQNVSIQWTAANIAAAGSTISLCFDQDKTVGNGNETWIEVNQVAAANGTASYPWNTTGVAPGKYYVGGYLSSNGQSYYSYAASTITVQGPPAPTFTVTAPTSGTIVAGQNVSIQWTAANVPAGSTISLAYDPDRTMGNGNDHWIEVDQISAANGKCSFTWNTTGATPGTYYVGGYLWANNKPTFSYLTTTIKITAGAPLTVDASLPPQGSTSVLSDQQLAPIVTEAERQWAAADGIQVLAAMAGVKVEVADLAGGLLGETSGKTILIDQNAAGYGWFVDLTPNNNSEFANLLGPHALGAGSGSPAANRVDLLTTVMHELGHVLGLEHVGVDDLMSAALPLGERRTISDVDLIGVAAAEHDSVDRLFATWGN